MWAGTTDGPTQGTVVQGLHADHTLCRPPRQGPSTRPGVGCRARIGCERVRVYNAEGPSPSVPAAVRVGASTRDAAGRLARTGCGFWPAAESELRRPTRRCLGPSKTSAARRADVLPGPSKIWHAERAVTARVSGAESASESVALDSVPLLHQGTADP